MFPFFLRSIFFENINKPDLIDVHLCANVDVLDFLEMGKFPI